MAANDVPCCEPMFWLYLIICVALVAFAGLMSGLTLGLMSLSIVDLEVLSRAGNPQDRRNAAKILPLVKNQHLLLCTLLIGNSLAMEALPIFLDALLPAWGAILISVTLILAFGEIIPQAVCSRYGLSVGAKLSVIVRLLVLLFFPVSYPISKLLDLLLGKGHAALLRRAELKTFVDMHGDKEGKGGELTNDETTIITGALDMTLKTAEDAMTPLSNLFSLDINSKLDEKTMGLIMSRGHSRVPIYSGSTQNIIGLILFCVQSTFYLNVIWLNEIIRATLPCSKDVKNLIHCRPEDETPIKDLTIRKIPRVHDKLPLYDMMNEFQKGHSHMAIVVRSNNEVKEIVESKSKEEEEKKRDEVVFDVKTEPVPSEDIIGIITLEDVMEELLQEEIWDETDEYVVVHNKLKINMVPSRRSSSRSPMPSPLSSNQPSPLSSYNQTPILRSPIPTFIPSPFVRPSLSSSPATYSRNSSPIAHSTPLGSPSSYKISRKSYEKLRQPFG